MIIGLAEMPVACATTQHMHAAAIFFMDHTKPRKLHQQPAAWSRQRRVTLGLPLRFCSSPSPEEIVGSINLLTRRSPI
jgi:hypothetical protein